MASGTPRTGEFVSRFKETVLVRFRKLAVLRLGLLSAVASGHSSSLDYVPVFIDSTGIEVGEKCFEGAKLRIRVIRHYQMHLMFVENLIVSLKLNEDSCIDAWRAVELKAGSYLRADLAKESKPVTSCCYIRCTR